MTSQASREAGKVDTGTIAPHTRLTGADLVLWRVGQIAALTFLALLIPLHPYPGSFLIKAVPVAALAVIVLRNVRHRAGYLLLAGLLLSVVGDVALDLDRERFFLVGLAAFLVAHVLYIAAFAHGFALAARRLPFAALVVCYAAVLAVLLRHVPCDKLVPVMAYLTAISAMVISAICIRRISPLLVVGAAVFMLSDTVIAINKFMYPIPHSTIYNIGLYFVAQFLIVRGFVNLHRTAR
jgi:uncharacterized membrane protein YhhN